MLSPGQVIPTALHSEMQRSYLEYAMSVIVGRALPDVRDGLKPVHRRILYAMHELGLTPDRPYRKCARVVGDVLGKYHPHGDQAVYDALVRMVQDFSSRYPLLAGHGNFGSVDNDPPAAMRYTETRLASISHEAMLSEIGEATVDFIGNFDNSQQEPVVLPALLPILLLNGCSGIAVGMATNIPPHNLGEVVDGLIALIDHPDLTDEQLFKLIPAPDFPTGGEIVGSEGIRDAYTTGKGSITVRGIAKFEEVVTSGKRKQRRTAIIVTELPFQVNKAAWIEKVAQLVNGGHLEGVADLRDESDRDGIRVVIEVKREANPESVLAHLYQQTALQSTFGAILLALVDGLPRQLSLRQLLAQFLQFREATLNRRYQHELECAQRRIHIVRGLVEALENLDALISILRQSADGTTAKKTLQQRYDLSDAQADAILAMPLRRITGLERQSLQDEEGQLAEQIAKLQVLLSDRAELLKALKKELRSLKRKYADPRRTRLPKPSNLTPAKAQEPSAQKVADSEEKNPTPDSTVKRDRKSTKERNSSSPSSSATPNDDRSIDQSTATQLSLLQEEAETVLEFTQRGYIRRLPISASSGERNSKKRKSPNPIVDHDFMLQSQIVKPDQNVLVLTRHGKAYGIKVRDIPNTLPTERGTPLISLLPTGAQSEQANIVKSLVMSESLSDSQLVLLTQSGRMKRLPMWELASLSSRGLSVFKLKEDDELLYANLTTTTEHLVLATTGGRLLRLEINDQQLPVMGRTGLGYPALPLGKREQLVAQVTIHPHGDLFLVSEQGYAKRMPLSALRLSNRGDLGTQALQFTSKTDVLAGMIAVPPTGEVIVITHNQRLVPIPVDSVALRGKDGSGERLGQLQPGEKVISVVSGE